MVRIGIQRILQLYEFLQKKEKFHKLVAEIRREDLKSPSLREKINALAKEFNFSSAEFFSYIEFFVLVRDFQGIGEYWWLLSRFIEPMGLTLEQVSEHFANNDFESESE